MRYAVALTVAAVIIGGAVLVVRGTVPTLERTMRQMLSKQQQAGTLPPQFQGVDLQTADLSTMRDFQMTLPTSMVRRLKISYWLTDFWYIWGLLVVIVCLGIASLFGAATKAEK